MKKKKNGGCLSIYCLNSVGGLFSCLPLSVEKIEKAFLLLWNSLDTKENKKNFTIPSQSHTISYFTFLNSIYFKYFLLLFLPILIFLFFSRYNYSYSATNTTFFLINFTIAKIVNCEWWTTYIHGPTTLFRSQLIVHYFDNCEKFLYALLYDNSISRFHS